VSWFAPGLEPLFAVAAATLDENGRLIEANAGFLRIIDLEGKPIGAPVARFFSQPSFAALIRADPAADGEIYRGLLTMGDNTGPTRTLRAHVWRVESHIRVLAEYNIEELERLNDKVLELNREYANAQMELAQTNFKLQQREAEIIALSLTDPLTGLGNRRRLEEALATEITRVERTGERFSIFMTDLDHFKRINDTYGHDAGDKVLTSFGDLLRKQTRATEILARFGGEEFIALMPHTGLKHALSTAERIRVVIASTRIEPLSERITASFGVAELTTGEKGDSLLRRVDKALYAAKDSGRNCVIAG